MLKTSSPAYLNLTRTGTYSFIVAIPLLVTYEILAFVGNIGRAEQIRIGPELWLKNLLATIGAAGNLALGIAILIVGGVILWRERKHHIPVYPRFLLWMLLESCAYAVLLGVLIGLVVNRIFMGLPVLMAISGADSIIMKLALSLGAGLYEELFFRVLLIGVLCLILRPFVEHSTKRYIVAALIGAFLFSAAHYIGPLGDSFSLHSFSFRFLFGLALNAIYITRGYGIAAWTHALYDIMILFLFSSR